MNFGDGWEGATGGGDGQLLLALLARFRRDSWVIGIALVE